MFRSAPRRMSTVFIYNGKGSEEECRQFLHESLLDSVDSTLHDIQFISAANIIEGSWTNKAKVLCFGGGYDLGFLESLGTPGIRMIREYVQNGGTYLGICAGAYFACDYIEFDKDGPLEVVGSRDLKFYPGKCIGPAFPGFAYKSHKGVHAVSVSYRNSLTLKTYLHGGGYFLPYTHSNDSEYIEVLGRFESLEQTLAAIVKCNVGQGCAVLSSCHVEFRADQLDMDDVHIKKCMPAFLESENKRNAVFRDLLLHSGLHLKGKTNNRFKHDASL